MVANDDVMACTTTARLNSLAGVWLEYKMNEGQTTILDVRNISPRDRHPLIFSTFDNLPQGGLTLVNGHDPQPLYYQFLHVRENQFSWDYLEQGPDVWRVQIGKTQKD